MSGEVLAAIIAAAGVALAAVLAWLRFRRKDSAETRQADADAALKHAQAAKTAAESDGIALATSRAAIAAWGEALERLQALETTGVERDRRVAELAVKLSRCEEEREAGRLTIEQQRVAMDDVARMRGEIAALRTRVGELERDAS